MFSEYGRAARTRIRSDATVRRSLYVTSVTSNRPLPIRFYVTRWGRQLEGADIDP